MKPTSLPSQNSSTWPMALLLLWSVLATAIRAGGATNLFLICPPDATVECPDPTTPAHTGSAVAFDLCEPGMITATHSDTLAAGNCPGAVVIMRTWAATNSCGASTTCVQRITVADTRPPVLTCAPNQTLECSQAINVTPPAVTDSCDPAPQVTFADVVTPGPYPHSQIITRRWTARDSCSNVASCDQVFTIVDTTPPVLSGCPPDVTVECSAVPAPPTPTAVDLCDVAPVVTLTVTRAAAACPEACILTRTWTARDNAGNTASCSQRVTVVDRTPPSVVCPPDRTVECETPTDPKVTGFAEATDDCDPSVSLTWSDVRSAGGCPQGVVITRTWRASDDCGNTSNCVQRITVRDRVAPSIICPPNMTIECHQAANPWITGVAGAVDECDPNPMISFTDTVTAGTCTNARTITRRWTTRDACTNTSFCEQVITVVDRTPPVLTCPPDLTVPSTNALDFGQPVMADNCDAEPALSFTDLVLPGPAADAPVICRTWTAIDACGNAASCRQIMRVVPPVRILSVFPDHQTGDVTLRWETRAGQVQLERAAVIGGPYSPISPVITGESFTDAGALTNQSCFYRLRQL